MTFVRAPRPLGPEEILARLLYKDSLILILDKPPGLAVHPGPGKGPHLEDSFRHLAFGLPRPPALAHRLDRDTSGCLVLGRHPKALRKLGRLFTQGQVEKTYWALAVGAPPDEVGEIDLPLAKRSSPSGGWRIVVDPAGQTARTRYRTLGRAGGFSWLELQPRTGRTHQIRVHLAALGCPILADPLYGTAEGGEGFLHLLARKIALPLYASRPAVTATAQPPPHLQEKLTKLFGWPESYSPKD